MRHGNIRDVELFLSQLWPWDIFDECFSPTRIHISDIDGAVERNGSVLLIETKMLSEVHRDIPAGQRYMFDALAAKPGITVIILWGNPGEPQYIQVWGCDNTPKPTDLSDIKLRLRKWFLRANRAQLEKTSFRERLRNVMHKAK